MARSLVVFAFDESSLARISDHVVANVALHLVDFALIIATMIITISALVHSYKASKFVWFACVLILGPFAAIIYAFVLGGERKHVNIRPR